MKIEISGCQVLRVVELPAREPYPQTQLVTLFQEATGDVCNLVCSPDCADALQVTGRDALVTVEANARQIDLAALGASRRGKAYKLTVMSVLPGKVKGL
jgi:hypothetical protein